MLIPWADEAAISSHQPVETAKWKLRSTHIERVKFFLHEFLKDFNCYKCHMEHLQLTRYKKITPFEKSLFSMKMTKKALRWPKIAEKMSLKDDESKLEPQTTNLLECMP